MSPGWQFNVAHNLFKVLKRTPFALPVLNFDKFTAVIPIFSANSFEVIFCSTKTLSRLTCIIVNTSFLNEIFVFIFEGQPLTENNVNCVNGKPGK